MDSPQYLVITLYVRVRVINSLSILYNFGSRTLSDTNRKLSFLLYLRPDMSGIYSFESAKGDEHIELYMNNSARIVLMENA